MRYGDNFEGQYPPFSSFCEFISNEASIACGPTSLKDSTERNKHKTQDTRAQLSPLVLRKIRVVTRNLIVMSVKEIT